MFRTTAICFVLLTVPACTSLSTNRTPDPVAAKEMAGSTAMQEEAKILNRMISILSDANTLYAEAANMSNDATVTKELSGLAVERRQFGTDLQAHVADLGAMPAQSGEALGTAHRAWTQGRRLLENDTLIAAEEVLRGENYLVDEVEALLDQPLSPSTREMLVEELANIISDRDHLDATCKALAKRS